MYDPSITFNLVGKENISQKLAKKLKKTKYSATSLIMFLTLDLDVTQFGLDSGNIWYLKDENIDGIYHELSSNDVAEGSEFPAVFISCTTLKDPTSFSGRYHNFEVVTFIEYKSFDQFNHEKDHHGQAYIAFKEKIIAKLMNNVEKIIPTAKQHVVQVELGTPKTNQFYINSTNGNVYGTEKTFMQVGPLSFKHKTEIDNLFLCGASTLSHGVGGATHSGVEAAAMILNCSKSDLMKQDQDVEQYLRIYDAEDPTSWPEFIHTKRASKKMRFEESVI
jgi:all-trans-retinol 13,14-reductase